MAGSNTEVHIIAPKQIFPDVRGLVSSVSDWNQGDLLMFDTSAKIVRAVTAEGEGTYSLGIAQNNVTDGVPVGPYSGLATSSSTTAMSVNGPVYGNSYNMVLKTSETISPGSYVYSYPTGGANYVAATASSSATVPVGLYIGHITVTSAAAGTQIECLIGARYPNDSIKF